MRIAIALLVHLLLVSNVHAGNNELTLSETLRSLRTSSVNAVTEDSLFGGALSYGRYLGIDVLPGLELWGHGTFTWGGAEGTMFQTLSTELDSLGLTIGARARYRLHRRLDASVRLDVGATRAALAIRDDGGH